MKSAIQLKYIVSVVYSD